MDRRLILGPALAAIVGVFGVAACGPMPSGLPTIGPAQTASSVTSAPATPAPATPGPVVSNPAPTCAAATRLVAVRATDPATGFPLAVEWIGLGSAADTFFTQSEVAPQIPIDPSGPASIIVALQYISAAGDRFKLTGGSLTLAFDPATGKVTGPLDTGYGKNSNQATTDTMPSQLAGTYTRPAAAGGSGMLEGTITYPDRETYQFKVVMTERQETVLPPGCQTPRPTDTL